jgi:hypothetical protein
VECFSLKKRLGYQRQRVIRGCYFVIVPFGGFQLSEFSVLVSLRQFFSGFISVIFLFLLGLVVPQSNVAGVLGDLASKLPHGVDRAALLVLAWEALSVRDSSWAGSR